MIRRFAAALAVAAVTLLGVVAVVLVGPALADSEVDRTIADPRITESSGLAESARHDGVLYTHNDSDDGPDVYAIDADGDTVATLTLRGAEARDWEAISPGRAGSDTLWVGDIGDNITAWPSIRAYRFDEPERLRDGDVAWTQYDLVYEDGPRNAESLLVHPRTGRLYVVTKNVMGGALYAAPAKLNADGPNTLRRVSKSLPLATDAAFSPDGRHFVVRGYVNAAVYATDEPGTRVATVDLPLQSQGESIAWTRDGDSFLVGSEGSGSDVLRVDVPDAVSAASPTGDPTAAIDGADATDGTDAADPAEAPTGDLPGPTSASETTGGSDDDGLLPRGQLLWLTAAAIVLIVLGLSMRAWARRDDEAR